MCRLSQTQGVRHESINKKKSYFHCSPLWKMDNNVEVINVAYDKWILRASEGSLGPRLCEKPMRQLCGGRGSVCAPSAERGC